MNLKNVKLNFGIEALEWLDKHYEKIETPEGITFSGVIPAVILDIIGGNLPTLSKLIHAGTLNAKKVLGIQEINKAIEELSADEIEELFNRVFTTFANSAPVLYQANKLQIADALKEAVDEITKTTTA